MQNIGIIGAGTMGNGIALVFAQYGFEVRLVDKEMELLNKALVIIQTNLDKLISKGSIHASEKASILSRIKPFADLRKAILNCELIIESATENFEIKREIFKEVDRYSGHGCILASNTSSISITKIAGFTTKPDMVIGMHFMNPAPVMKLVEIIRGLGTSDHTCNTIKEITRHLKKTPCVVQDYPGFISNRILLPMINEAIYTLFEHIAGAEEIDTIMKLGMSHPMGPLQLADFIGLDICQSILNIMYDEFKNPKYAPCPLLNKMVSGGKLGVKTGEGFYKYS